MEVEFLAPSTAEEAVRAMAGPGRSVALAGGTDLLPDLEDGRASADRIVSLTRLPWNTFGRSGGRLRIGSTVPMRSLERDPTMSRDLPGLYAALRSVGSVPLRHRATLGGNLARGSPASDLLPILLALDAQVHLVGPSGSRTTPLAPFLRASRSVDLGPGELIEAVELPSSAPSAYVWQRVRPSNDISQVGVAVARPPGSPGWAVALGGVVPKPVRVPRAEEHLRAARPTREECERAAEIAAREAPFASDRRATETYRRGLVKVLLGRALAEAGAREAAA